MPLESTQLASRLAGYKRIILCADGTWLASDLGNASVPSNVARIARTIATSGPDPHGNIVPQIVSYHSGLGAGELPFQKAIYGGIGWGLDNEVCQIYEFISNNYVKGDELFFFGFSRGAFTVRSVAGLVSDIGVLSSQHMSHFAEMWKAYRENSSGQPFRKTEWYQQNQGKLRLEDDVRIKVVGVWDTVGALGIPNWPLVNLVSKLGINLSKQYVFHNTNVSKNYAFQALAIDERRLTFPPTLWHRTQDAPAKDLQQCWFPGVHTNIGGGAPEREIEDITFAWMVDNLSGMLTFESVIIEELIQQHRASQAERNALDQKDDSWGCGYIKSNFAGLKGTFFRVLGKQDRTPGNYPQVSGDDKSARTTNESFHPIARIRKTNLSPDYTPAALAGYVIEGPGDDGGSQTGWQWIKKDDSLALPEYVLRPDQRMTVMHELEYETRPSLSRSMCPKSLLADLDRHNGIPIPASETTAT
ncbi:hypothetical protein N7462_005467 [Penicillium macrosclerotiorum]|uniref:uncharacterized protein n=1 Tax=Penicillium macrosclerotiorum TaxID=303699 RepID=UPI0025487068|nr:uncharacterized protein N7462_005467 [Penicillium macrosclerotiorum]KAJ5682302.1 hypothetical protein N7462_005467 [Penicillium macrosclerotiorum]